MTAGRRWHGVALAAALLAGCATAGPGPTGATPASRPYVVVVSLDGVRHDYLDRYHPPALERLAARGTRAEALIPPFPAKTFPSHYTLATGLHPGRHGIAGNAFFDPAHGRWYRPSDTAAVRDGHWYAGEPLWATAARQGVLSATYFWPGSEAVIGGGRPTYSKSYDARIPNARRVDEAIGWLRLPPAARPHLVMMYVSEVDDTTHRHGPDAPQTAPAVARADAVVQRLLDSLAVLPIRDSVNVVVVSDHGMTTLDSTRRLPVLDLLLLAGVDTAGVLTSDNGPTMSLWLGGDAGRIERVRAALAASLPGVAVHRNADIPARLHAAGNARFGDLLLIAPPGAALLRRATDRVTSRGTHGYDSIHPEMHGIFIAAGPDIRRAGRVPAFASVEVYALIAAVLRLEHLPETDGTGAALAYLATRPN